MKLKRCIEDIITNGNGSRDEGMTFEEIEALMRCKNSRELDIDKHTQFSAQLRNALNNGINKRKYTKEGKFYKLLTKFPNKSPTTPTSMKRDSTKKNNDHLTRKEREMLKQICGFCKGDVDKNKRGEPEDLLTCDDCGNSGHPSCMKYSDELTARVREEDSWQCMECKRCHICKEVGEANHLLFCDACDRGYHMECLRPPVHDLPIGTWLCKKCAKDAVHTPRKRGRPAVSSPATTTPVLTQSKLPIEHWKQMNEKNKNKRRGSVTSEDEENVVVPKKKKKGSGGGDDAKKQPLTTSRLPGVTEKDEKMFQHAQEKANSYLTENNEPAKEPGTNARYIMGAYPSV